MIFTSMSFKKIESENKLGKFTGYSNEELNTLIDTTLETTNIVIFLFNIVKIISKVNKVSIDTSFLEVRKLLLKVNISQNRINLKYILDNLDAQNQEIKELNEIIDKTLLNNFEAKMDILENLEPLCRVGYPDFDDLLLLNRLKVEEIVPEKKEEVIVEESLTPIIKSVKVDGPVKKTSLKCIYSMILILIIVLILCYYLFTNNS